MFRLLFLPDRHLYRLLAMAMLCCLPASGRAQKTLRLKIPAGSGAEMERYCSRNNLRPHLPDPQTLVFPVADSAAVRQRLQHLVQYFRAQSYLSASIDSLYRRDSSAHAVLYTGPPMHWLQLRLAPGADLNWLDAAGFRPHYFQEAPLRHDVLLNLEKRLLENAENNGYPFAAIWLDSIRIAETGAVSAILHLEKGRFFVFGPLQNKGDLKVPAAFLPNYLGLKPGMPYSRAKVLRLSEQLKGLLFVESAGNPSVTFSGDQAGVNLFLKKKRAGRFDFIIGLLPQSETDNANTRLLLTGSLSAAFQNALNLGERLSIDFDRLRPETQKMEVQGGVPYLLGSPFGLEGKLHIFRRDSSWVDAQSDLGVQYLLTGGNVFRFFWENRSSALQKVDTAAIRRSRQLPANLDFRQTGFGVDANLSQLDYRFNPRRGWLAQLKTSAGFNKVRRNSQIEAIVDPAFDFRTLYDTVAGQRTRFRVEFRGEYYVPLFRRSTLKLALRSGGIVSSRPVYNNEQFRLGGGNPLRLTHLRGFDEESLFATRFAVSTLEWRLLLGQNSYLSAFTDYAYLENITNRTRAFLRPWGIGGGMNFETRAGIFGISIAAGRRDTGQVIDFRAAKFHIGYVSLF